MADLQVYGIGFEWDIPNQVNRPTLRSADVERETPQFYFLAEGAAVAVFGWGSRTEKSRVSLTPQDAWDRFIQEWKAKREAASAQVAHAADVIALALVAREKRI